MLFVSQNVYRGCRVDRTVSSFSTIRFCSARGGIGTRQSVILSGRTEGELNPFILELMPETT